MVGFIDKALDELLASRKADLAECDRERKVYERALKEARARCKQIEQDIEATTGEQTVRAAAKSSKGDA